MSTNESTWDEQQQQQPGAGGGCMAPEPDTSGIVTITT